MSQTNHPDERERLHQIIADGREQLGKCGNKGGPCSTCRHWSRRIDECEAAIAALDADDADAESHPVIE